MKRGDEWRMKKSWQDSESKKHGWWHGYQNDLSNINMAPSEINELVCKPGTLKKRTKEKSPGPYNHQTLYIRPASSGGRYMLKERNLFACISRLKRNERKIPTDA